MNVGHSEKLPKFSICDTYNTDEWINKILYILENYDKLIKDYNINLNSDISIMQFIE